MTHIPTLLVVHAHPDDEVFSTGGIIARYAREGARVVLVYGTNGEAGEIHHPELDPIEAATRLGEIRREEVREACAILGATDLFFLGYRDSGMKDTAENQDPSNFMNAPLQEAVDRLLAIMREVEADVVVTYDADGGYGHPDHIKTHQVTVAAFDQAMEESWGPKKLYFAARSRESFRRYVDGLARFNLKIPWIKDDEEFNFDEFGLPDAAITAHIDISEYAALKKRALAVHRTQIPADHFYLSIPDEALREVAGVEYFVRIVPPADPGERESDLFSRIGQNSEAVA